MLKGLLTRAVEKEHNFEIQSQSHSDLIQENQVHSFVVSMDSESPNQTRVAHSFDLNSSPSMEPNSSFITNMELGNSNQAEAVHNFDLNSLPSAENLDCDVEKEVSPPTHKNPSQVSQDVTEKIDTDRNKEVHVVDTPANSTAVAADGADSSAAVINKDDSTIAAADGTISSVNNRVVLRRTRRYHRNTIALRPSDTSRRCTNSTCGAIRTPVWRKGPLGPKTLCNACGLQYIKMLTSQPTTPVNHDASSSVAPARDQNDAVPDPNAAPVHKEPKI